MIQNRLQHVDVWRFVALGLVLVCHIVAYSHPWYKEVAPALVWRLREIGTLGVQIFFCISGYVICRGMLREQANTGTVDIRAFYLRRAYRIMPPLLVFIAFLMMLTWLGILDIKATDIVRSAVFLCNWEPWGQCNWAVGHTWSLAYEEQFYLVFPLLFSVLLFAAKPARILVLAAGIAAGCVIAHVLSAEFVGNYLGHFLCILSGCVCALYWERIEPLLKRLPVAAWLLAVALIPAACMFQVPAAVRSLVYPLVLPVIMCIAVFGTPLQQPVIGKIFTHATLAYVGRMSYSVYLWQQAACLNYGFMSPVFALVLMGGVFVFAHYSYRYFEQPMIGLGARHIANKGRAIAVRLPDDPLADDPFHRPRF